MDRTKRVRRRMDRARVVDEKEPPKKVEYVKPPNNWFAYIEKISVVGDVFIRLNPELKRKDNFNLTTVNRDCINLYVDYTKDTERNDFDMRDYNFTWDPTELTKDHLIIRINFTKPFSIS